MTTNFPQPVTAEADGFDPFDSASNPTLPAFELWGMVEINAWACALVKGQGKVPFNAQDPNHKRFTAIDVFIQPLPELNITNTKTCEGHMLGESKEWASITLASIKALGIDNVREINGKYARVTKVPNGRTYTNKDGETKDELTFKFVTLFEDEKKCRAAYFASNGNGHATSTPTPTYNEITAPVVDAAEQERLTALPFLNVIVPNASKGKKTLDEAKPAVAALIAQYPIVSKHFTVDSPEVFDLMMKNIG